MPAKKRTTARATATVSPPESSARPSRTSDDAVGHIDAATALLCAALQRLANGSHPPYPSPPPLYPMIAHAAFHDVFGDLHDKTPPESCDVKLLPEAVKWLKSNVHRMKHRATLFVRKLVSVESNPPLDDVVASGATPLLAELLLDHAHPRTQLEAAWALTNVASGTAEQTQHVVDLGVLPHFVLLLSSPDEAVREQAVWALGNIAGDGARFRDVVLHLHPLPLLSAIIHDHTSIITVKRNAAWTISNLCRSKPPPAFDDVLPAVAIVDHVCGDESCDREVLVDALWALSYLSDASDQMRDHILQHHAAAVQRCVALLSLPCSAALATPSMRALGNFAAGTADQTTAVLDMGAVTCFSSWLAPHQKRALRKEACWTLSNITADSPRGVTEVINAGLMPQIVALAQSPEFEVKKEALWCVSNAVTTGGTLGADHVMSCNAHVALIASLRLYDVKLVLLALETVDAILTSSSQPDANKAAMEECGLFDAVDELQNHSLIDVYNPAVQFLSKHFDAREDGESAEDNPTTDQ